MKYAHRHGFALAEVLVAVFVLAILSVAVFSTATVGIKTSLQSEFTTVAQGLAEDEAVKISLMAYDAVVTGGTFPANETVTQNGQPYDITRTVTLVDDPVNGTVSGTLTEQNADYKQVDIVLTPPGLPTRPVELTTLVIRQVAPATPVTSFTCGNTLTDDRDGTSRSYSTVVIGTQCWMGENMNIGTRILGTAEQPTNCSEIKKYCYDNDEANCTIYGALYQWAHAMCGSRTARAQGICPAGWHIPTHDEFTTLERAVCTQESMWCEFYFPRDYIMTGWRGTVEGSTLKSAVQAFRAPMAGFRQSTGEFISQNIGTTYLWTSIESPPNAWSRGLSGSNVGVNRGLFLAANGASVRCVKD